MCHSVYEEQKIVNFLRKFSLRKSLHGKLAFEKFPLWKIAPEQIAPLKTVPGIFPPRKIAPSPPLEICPQENCSRKTTKFDFFCSTKDKTPILN